ncbi:MAG: bifunctional hydroxymethylpyrimidine kinase/phosphomethylpyrimidine kinase [Rhodospirillaceae bacterium]|nr:bifunctional hydroxymethylpyrimidine kinase/phosphomethylpyrimidine kinase [Rhodospirillaceae bacterium]
MKGRVLIVAGSDSGGGAGIQADIKSVTALGGFAATAITALTAQNTFGVHDIFPVDIGFIQTQMRVVLKDIGTDSLKTGMLHSPEVIDAVCAVLETEAVGIPVVVDPVMVAKGGASLLSTDAVATLRNRLLPLARVITPNIPEAEDILQWAPGTLQTIEDMKTAAESLKALGSSAVLVKGGHMKGDDLFDVLLDDDGFYIFETQRIDTTHTHGTGCTLASSIATGIAQGLALPQAVGRAQAYVVAAIKGAPGFGGGHGPIDHGHTVSAFEGI